MGAADHRSTNSETLTSGTWQHALIISGMLPSLPMKPSLAIGPLALFRQGRFSECLDRLRGSTNPSDVLLRTECLLYLCRPNEIVRMDSLAQLADVPEQYQYLAQSLIASAFFAAGMNDSGYAALDAAYDSVALATDLHAKLWVDFAAAKERWTSRDYDKAEQLVRAATYVKGVLGAKALALLSWIEAGRERFDRQIVLLRRAWDTLSPGEDVYTEGMILRALSHLSTEVYDRELASFVERANDRITWPPDLAFEHIETLRAIAWNYALAGNLVPAIRQFRRNESLAHDPAGRLLVLTDRARIALGSGEHANFRALLEDAEEISQRVDWNNATSEQRFGLLSLAALWSQVNPEQGRDTLHRYQGVTVPGHPMFSWSNGDSRRLGAEHYAAGVVCLHLRQRAEALEHLREAYSIYKRIKYYWRACLCAYHLGEIGYDKGTMNAALIWIRERFPHAWFAPLFHQAQAFQKDTMVNQLTRVPREILRLLLLDMSVHDIASTLERDEKTVRNHISSIFRAFGVKNRDDLLRVCEERGLR